MVGVALTTLRLFRAPIVATAALVSVLVLLAVMSGSQVEAAVSAGIAAGCQPSDCVAIADRAQQDDPFFGQLLPFLQLLPAVIGAFWGAPLVGREFDSGTAKLAWTQSVSRLTWLLGRVLVLGTIVVGCGGAVGVAVDRWFGAFEGYGPFGDIDGAALSFSQVRGIGPVGWWLLGFAVGVFWGAVLRRTVVAMAVTAAAMVGLMLARNIWFGVLDAEWPPAAEMQLLRTESAVFLLVSAALILGAGAIVQRSRV